MEPKSKNWTVTSLTIDRDLLAAAKAAELVLSVELDTALRAKLNLPKPADVEIPKVVDNETTE